MLRDKTLYSKGSSTKRITLVRFICLLVATILLITSVSAGATIYTGVTLAHNDYDYAPSVMYGDGASTKMWWAGFSGDGDAIFYSTLTQNVWSTPQQVMQKSSSGWDSLHTCDPSVIKGSFSYNSQTYSYALYYTGTYDRVAGNDGHIGVAFSNDGVNWVKNSSNPIINPYGDATNQYGVGMPTVYRASDGTITMVYFDSTDSNGNYMVTSTDGINFSNKTRVPNPLKYGESIGDIAYSPSEEKWYVTTKMYDDYMNIYETANSSLLSKWNLTGYISQDTTGNTSNHNPGWLRYQNGDIYSETGTNYKHIYFGTGVAGHANSATWEIGHSIYTNSWELNVDGNKEGWTANNVSNDTGPSSGLWVITANQADPYLLSSNMEFPSATYDTIQLRVANQNSNANGKIYFKTDAENYFSEDKSVSFTCLNGGGWFTYSVNMSANTKWVGKVTGIRIDPIETGSSQLVGIDYIKFMNCAYQFDFSGLADTEGWTANNVTNNSGPGSDGLWVVNANQSDPYWVSQNMSFSAASFPFIKTRIANQNSNTNGKIYFKTDSEDYYSEDKAVNFTCLNGGGWVAYSIYMEVNAKWTGNITGIRMDPIETGSSQALGIDYINASRMDEVSVSSLSSLTESSGNPTFTITFDKNITTSWLPHINAERWWVEANNSVWGYPYTTAILDQYENSGARYALENLVLFDGLTLTQMKNKEPDNWNKNTTVMVHIVNNQMQFFFQNNGANDIDINLEHKITFLPGFKTISAYEVVEAQSFTYVPSVSSWFRDIAPTKVSSVSEINGLNTFSVLFDKSPTDNEVLFFNRIADGNMSKVLFNGKSIAQMQAETDQDIFQIHVNNVKNGVVGLNFYIDKLRPALYNFKFDGTDKIKFLNGFRTPTGIITQDIEFTFAYAVASVTLNKSSTTIENGYTEALVKTVNPSYATNQNVTWVSSNTSIATVNSSGVVTAIATGTATITATTVDGGFMASCVVTTLVHATGVTLDKSTISIGKGVTSQLTATVNPTNATNKAVTWSSSNTAVATVSAAGLVTAIAVGTATITVTTVDGGFTATCAATVTRYDSLRYYKIAYSPNTALVLDATNTGLGGVIKHVTYNSSTVSQQWQIIEVSSGVFKIINKATGYALDVTGGTNTIGKNIIQSTYVSSNRMNWRITDSTTYVKVNSLLGTNTYIKGTGTSGATLVTAATSTATSQRWVVTLIP